MEEQRITLSIAGKQYELKVDSEQKEHLMRQAAIEVNKTYEDYLRMFPQKSNEDKLALTALQQAMSKIDYREKLTAITKSMRDLDNMLATYLSVEEVKSR